MVVQFSGLARLGVLFSNFCLCSYKHRKLVFDYVSFRPKCMQMFHLGTFCRKKVNFLLAMPVNVPFKVVIRSTTTILFEAF